MTGLDEDDNPIDYRRLLGVPPRRSRINWGCLVVVGASLLTWIVLVVWLCS